MAVVQWASSTGSLGLMVVSTSLISRDGGGENGVGSGGGNRARKTNEIAIDGKRGISSINGVSISLYGKCLWTSPCDEYMVCDLVMNMVYDLVMNML